MPASLRPATSSKRPARLVETLDKLAVATRAIIALRVGQEADLTPQDGNLAAERARMASRIRTARLITRRRYRTETRGRRLYVICTEGE